MKRYKYGRTYHLPWSLGISDDDKVLKDVSCFYNKQVVVTEKMDGENSSLYFDGYTHARSIDSLNHESRTWLKNFWNERFWKCYNFNDVRICGENVYAKHSIHYNDLKSYFLGFSVWQNQTCFSWKETLRVFNLLDIENVPVIYEGIFDEELIRNLQLKDNSEGYVVRLASEFTSENFKTSIAKFVRKNHVQTDKHWMQQKVVRNVLKGI